LEILRDGGALAFPALASLVTTYSEQPLSDEIAVGVEEVSITIAEAAHKQGQSPTADQLKSLASYAVGQRPLVARNLIHEFKNEALPIFISTVAISNQSLSEDTRIWLQSVDSNGVMAMRAAISTTPNLTKEQVQNLMSNIPLPNREALPLFVKDLIELASKPELAKVFAPLLGRACESLGGLTVDPNLQITISMVPEVWLPGTLSEKSAICLTQSSLPLAKQVKHILKGEDANTKAYLIELISKGLRSSSNEVNSEIISALKELALDTQSANWTAALSALATFPERDDEIVSIALQLFKQANKSTDPAKTAAIMNVTFESLKAAKLSREAISKIMPQITSSIRSSKPDAAAIELAKSAVSVDPLLITLGLTSPPTANSLKALEILATRTDLPQKALLPLVDLLRFPEAQLLAEQCLYAFRKDAPTAIKKTLPRLAGGATKPAALGLLIHFGNASKPELREFVTFLSSQDNCSFIKQREGLLCDLAKIQDSDTEIKTKQSALIARCLPELTAKQIESLTRCDPQSVLSAAESIGAASAAGTLSADKLAAITDLSIRMSSEDSKKATSLINQILLHGADESRQRNLTKLAIPQEIDPTIQESLRKISAAADPKSPIYTSALKALAASRDQTFDWREFVKSSIESAKGGSLDPEITDILSTIPDTEVLAEVVPALESDNSDKLVGAALVGAALGPKAVPIVSRLWHLREKHSPAVRYTAALALLEINPLTPDMHETVKRILVNRFFKTAESMPITWSNTVAVNDLDRGTFGTLRNERLMGLLNERRPM
jgi:hypothetical protein